MADEKPLKRPSYDEVLRQRQKGWERVQAEDRVEAKKVDAKTARLKELRLAKEAAEAASVAETPKKPRRTGRT